MLLLSLAFAMGVSAKAAYAATTITVDCTTDPGALAGALASASDGDTLIISGTCDGTFEISHRLTLQGSSGATLDGQRASTVVVQIDPGMTVNMTGLSITGGFLSGGGTCPGGGVANHGTLTLSKVTLSGNQTDYGVCNDVGATLTATNSTIRSNGSGAGGGGVLNNGTMTLISSSVTANSGYTGGFGGGVVNTGTLTLSDSTVSSNSGGEGGGIYSSGTLTVTNSTVSDNTGSFSGGGIFNRGIITGGTLTVTNSTVSGNTASGLGSAGGGIYNFVGGNLTLTNSTVSGNSASVAGGILTQVAATTTLKNTIVAGQTSGGNCAGVGSLLDGGYNLDDDGSCGLSTANHSLPNTNPLLDPAGLKDNSGPTQTIALLPGSPAIDAIPPGINGCGTTITTDQRGVSRPQGPGCDIGAFEARQSDTTPPVVTVPGPITVNATSPTGAAVTYSVSATDPDDAVASLSCAPTSGSTFPIGTTTISCTASDTHGNASSATFAVHVKGAPEQLADLGEGVVGVGPGTSLADKVSQVQTFLTANDMADACSTLTALVNELKAQSGKTIESGQATTLIATTQRIEAVLGC